nr:hypothetical protein [Escherichia coli]
MSGAKLPDALRLSGLHETIESEWFCRPDKAFTPHPAFGARCLMRFAYQAYEFAHIFMFAPVRRPDKAFTPHPAKQRARCQNLN